MELSIYGTVNVPGNLTREELVSFARTTNECKRYDDVLRILGRVIIDYEDDLRFEERELLKDSSKFVFDSKLEAWRKAHTIQLRARGDNDGGVNNLKIAVSDEIKDFCARIQAVCNHLLTRAASIGSQVSYSSFKADYYAYVSEVHSSPAKNNNIARALSIYQATEDLALLHLQPNDFDRIQLVHKYSIFKDSQLKQREEAYEDVRKALAQLKGYQVASGPHILNERAAAVVKMLRENQKLWAPKEKHHKRHTT